jgi:sugar (pentulose or hexulose) kinase
MSANFILLDIGGTDIKTAVVSSDSQELCNLKRVAFPGFHSADSLIREIDSDELLKLIKSEINLQIASLGKIDGLLISGQMACWKFSNVSDVSESPIVSWQDKRSTKLQEINLRQELLAANGGESKEGLPALGLLQMLDTNQKSDKNSNFETMGSWIARSLCEIRTSSKTHITDAAATGIYDIYKNKWIPNLLDEKLSGITFPDVTRDLGTVGFLKNTSIPVYVPVGDQQASLLGAGLDKTRIVVNIGTGGQVAVISQRRAPSNWLTRPYFFDEFIQTKTHLPAGRLISTMHKLLKDKYNSPLDYESITTIELGSSNLINIESLFPENCERIFETELSKGKGIMEVVCLILTSVATIYIDSIGDLEDKDDLTILFAGGVGQKFTNFHKYFEHQLGIKIEVSSALETSLQGLAQLISTI